MTDPRADSKAEAVKEELKERKAFEHEVLTISGDEEEVKAPMAGSEAPPPAKRRRLATTAPKKIRPPKEAPSPKRKIAAKKRTTADETGGDDDGADGGESDSERLDTRRLKLRPSDADTVYATVATELGVGERQVRAAMVLLDDGATVPFVARYRKEATEGLEAAPLRALAERVPYLRELQLRKQAVLQQAEQQGKLTSQLQKAIESASTKIRLEDLYTPLKPKRQTKAAKAREHGLEPLAYGILNNPRGDPAARAEAFVCDAAPTAKAALEGARQLLIDLMAEDPAVVGHSRDHILRFARIRSIAIKTKAGAPEAAVYRDFFDYTEPLARCASHRALAILRGQTSGFLRVTVEIPQEAQLVDHLLQVFSINRAMDSAREWLVATAQLAWKRMALRLRAQALRELRARAQIEAIAVFAKNLGSRLLAPPAGPRVTMGLDPGFRQGTKVVVVDGMGRLLDSTVVPTHGGQASEATAQKLAEMCRMHGVELISLGDGTGSREAEAVVRRLLQQVGSAVVYARTPEDGASVYSASKLAEDELPGVDIIFRGAVSIARRLQDPLAEYVKVPPEALGLGQYQHDLDPKGLAKALAAAIEDCVNGVGVHVNTASPALLQHVSGLNAVHAASIVTHRQQHGPFRNRGDLRRVRGIGPVTFERAAGFLRIPDGDDPLDATGIHPERYALVKDIALACGVGVGGLLGNRSVLSHLDVRSFLGEGTSELTVRDIVLELLKPGRDPRPPFQATQFARNVCAITDLAVGMMLPGTVKNVANFGAFVDVGVHQCGLIHVSQLGVPHCKTVHDVVHVGQSVHVEVLTVDLTRNRIGLRLRHSPAAAV